MEHLLRPEHMLKLREMYTLSGETTESKLICFPSEKGSSVKGNNLFPVGTNSFLLK